MPSASFCLLLSVHCRKMSKIKVLGKFYKKYQKNIQVGRLERPEGGPEGGHPLARRLAGAARGAAAPPGRLVRWGLPWCPPFAYISVFLQKPSGGAALRDFPHCSAAAAIPISGSLKNLSRHPAGGRNHLRKPLHHHDRLPDVP